MMEAADSGGVRAQWAVAVAGGVSPSVFFDDRLATVLRHRAAGENAARTQYQQLLDQQLHGSCKMDPVQLDHVVPLCQIAETLRNAFLKLFHHQQRVAPLIGLQFSDQDHLRSMPVPRPAVRRSLVQPNEIKSGWELQIKLCLNNVTEHSAARYGFTDYCFEICNLASLMCS